LLLAEVVLTAVDDILISKLGTLDGFHFIDDYELCFPTLSHAEKALHELESVLAVFELSLNPSKTQIYSVPLSLQDNWATELNHFGIRPSPDGQRNDLTGFFSRAIELSSANPEKSVLRYAIARFRKTPIDPANVSLLQNLLLRCVSCEQGTIPFVLEQLVRLYLAGHSVPRVELEKVLNSQIQYHGPLGHTSEVAWSLWGAIAFGIVLNNTSANIVSNIDDSIVALLALDADSRGLFPNALNMSNWVQYMTPRSLYEENWLLSYEANIKGWMRSATGVDHVVQDPNFGFRKSNGVEFYDLANAVPVIPKATQPLLGPSEDVSPA
jgi:hypothetical protein